MKKFSKLCTPFHTSYLQLLKEKTEHIPNVSSQVWFDENERNPSSTWFDIYTNTKLQ